MEACIKENLRIHPIASEMGRRTMDKEIVIDDVLIPPYTVVSASYRSLHLDERYWPQPERFWPERWLGEEESEGAPKPWYAATCQHQRFGSLMVHTVWMPTTRSQAASITALAKSKLPVVVRGHQCVLSDSDLVSPTRRCVQSQPTSYHGSIWSRFLISISTSANS